MGKTTKGAPTPVIKLDDLDSQYARLTLNHPATTQPIADAWMEVAGIHSQEFEDAKVAALIKHRTETAGKTLSEEEQIRAENMRFRAAIGHLIVNWNEAFFGPYSKEQAVEYMTSSKKLWMYVQVEQFVTQQERFFKA